MKDLKDIFPKVSFCIFALFFVFACTHAAAQRQAVSSLEQATAVAEQTTPPDDFEWQAYNGGVSIIGYVGESKQVVIPGAINGIPVTSIGDRAFYKKELTSVIIPDPTTTALSGRGSNRPARPLPGGTIRNNRGSSLVFYERSLL